MQQIATGTSASHDISVYTDGVLTDLDTAPTYTITDQDGTSVASGTASVISTGIYRVTIPPQSQVAVLDIAWSGTLSSTAWTQDTQVEIVGEHLFTIAELWSFGKGLDSSVYSAVEMAEIRSTITDEFASICGVSFIPRYRRETLPGTATHDLEVSWPRVTEVISASFGGTSVAGSSFVAASERSHVIRYKNGYFPAASSSDPRNVTIAYRHGYETVPPDIRQAGLVVARARAIRNVQGTGVPSHASAWSDATGTFQSFAANDATGRWYGMPEVDVPLRRFRVAPAW